MTLYIRYSTTGVPEAISRLTKLDLAGRDLTLAFFAIQQRLEGYEKQQFDSEGAWGSGGWAPLKPAYKAWKDQHFPGMPILQRTQALMKSLTEEVAEGAIREIEPHMMVFGTSIEYAKFHKTGTPNMVARDPLPAPRVGIRGFFTRIIKDTIMAQITWEQSGGFNGPHINEDLSTP
jgi:phage gpG-like protein